MKYMPSYKMIFISALLAAAMTTACSGTGGQTVVSSQDTSAAEQNRPAEVSILQTWSGEYPVEQLVLLPDGQMQSSVGFIADATTFAAVWQTFKPSENLPEVDFNKNFVVFTRNVKFFNRTNIFKVTLTNGVAEVLSLETRSALPIEDRVAMALAVIPRAGVRFIQIGKGQITVR